MDKFDRPLVSIIIPCFNAEKYLAQALESILWQTYGNWECILVDDGSSDTSAAIYHTYRKRDGRFQYIFQKNAGPASARNTGIQAARGTYIQFLDADDLLLPDRLQVCVDKFQEVDQPDVVYSNYIIYDKYRGFWHSVPGKIPYQDSLKALLFENNITFVTLMHAFLFKRTIISQHPFDNSLGSYAEDIECWVRIAATGARFAYVEKILIVYRFSENTLTTRGSVLIDAKIRVLKSFSHYVTTAEYKQLNNKTESYLKEKLASAYFIERKFREGWNVLRGAWFTTSLKSKVKMLGWLALMIVFTRSQVERIRTFCIRYTPLRWGGWKDFSNWEAPKELKQLMKISGKV